MTDQYEKKKQPDQKKATKKKGERGRAVRVRK